MCGIVGYSFTQEPVADAVPFIEGLLVQSQMRGRHATGVAYIGVQTHDGEPTDNLLLSYKQPIAAVDFIKTNAWQNAMREGLPAPAAILHTRYSTSGDWNVNDNNQPLVLGDLALVHNGLVSMAEKATFEQQYSVQCQTANDSEILLQTIARLAADEESDLETAITGAMAFITVVEQPIHACGLLTRQGEVFCWRDNIRPLYRFAVPKWNLEGFCSTADIFTRACAAANVKGKVWQCKPGSVYQLQPTTYVSAYKTR